MKHQHGDLFFKFFYSQIPQNFFATSSLRSSVAKLPTLTGRSPPIPISLSSHVCIPRKGSGGAPRPKALAHPPARENAAHLRTSELRLSAAGQAPEPQAQLGEVDLKVDRINREMPIPRTPLANGLSPKGEWRRTPPPKPPVVPPTTQKGASRPLQTPRQEG